MKKKLGILLAVLLVAGASNVFAFGLGLQANANAEDAFASRGVALTFKFDSIPLIFAANWSSYPEITTVGLTGDYWAFNKPITRIGRSSLNWFFGVGFFLNVAVPQEEDFRIATGVRLPLGLNMFIADGVFEPFLQIAPSFGVRFIPTLAAENVFWPMALGFRIWFK